jgi:hypothetical protein
MLSGEVPITLTLDLQSDNKIRTRTFCGLKHFSNRRAIYFAALAENTGQKG